MAAERWQQFEVPNDPQCGCFKLKIQTEGEPLQIIPVPAIDFYSHRHMTRDYFQEMTTGESPLIVAARCSERGMCAWQLNTFKIDPLSQPKITQYVQLPGLVYIPKVGLTWGPRIIDSGEPYKPGQYYLLDTGIFDAEVHDKNGYTGNYYKVEGITIERKPFTAYIYFEPSPRPQPQAPAV